MEASMLIVAQTMMNVTAQAIAAELEATP